MTEEKIRENKLRRMAKRQGWVLRKSRRRDPRALDYGRYFLVDPSTNGIVYGYNGNFFDADLDDIEERLTAFGPGGAKRQFSERFRQMSTRYPRRVTEAFGGDHARAMAATDEEVRAAVREWEISEGLEPRDWEAIGAEERSDDG